MKWTGKLAFSISLGVGGVLGQTEIFQDTLEVKTGQKIYHLKHGNLIDHSFLLGDTSQIKVDSVQTVLGWVQITNQGGTRNLSISYRALSRPVPLLIGPLPAHISQLDSFAVLAEIKPPPTIARNASTGVDRLYTSGSFFRSLNLSTNGGTELGGGLRFQLHGRMGDDIQVSGTLTDESFPIQPEGNTLSLDEIDKVYLEVTHPNASIVAGDILYENKGGKYSYITRNLNGLKNKITIGDWQASGVVGSLKGSYHRLEFKGREGQQGPYFLTAKDGNRDVIIVAGSERVWLNGRLMTRGANHDYIIDYTTAELTFTPQQLIDFDRDILVEYQYSDFNYGRGVFAASIRENINERGSIEISWIREKDRIGQSITSAIEKTLLDSVGDGEAAYLTYAAREDGDYVLQNEILVYDPDYRTSGYSRYAAAFYYAAGRGTYARRISKQGRIYYEFLPEEQRYDYQDLYLPERNLVKPTDHQLANLSLKQIFTRGAWVQADLTMSGLDKNILSARDDDNNWGLAHHVQVGGDSLPLVQGGNWSYRIESWNRNSRFKEMQNDREVLFYREWNLKPLTGSREEMQSLYSSFNWGATGGGDLSIKHYKRGNETLDRIFNNIYYNGKYINQLKSYMNIVKSEKTFYQGRVRVDFLEGNLNPFLSLNYEMVVDSMQYSHYTAGYQYRKKNIYTAISLGRRTDLAGLDTTSGHLEEVSKGYFGAVDWSYKSTKGWNQSLTLRKRILNQVQTTTKQDFMLGRIVLNFRNRTSPFQWDITADLDESFSERRAVVYDSVGIGLGHYRFDPNFNVYIPDEKGSFVARTIFIGDRLQTTKFTGTQRLVVDFSRTNIGSLKDWDYRLDARSDFQGSGLPLNKALNPHMEMPNINIARWTLRHEFDYLPQKSRRRLRIWLLKNRSLDGQDPRGPELTQKAEAGLFVQSDHWREYQAFANAEYRDINVGSAISFLRDRSLRGYSAELGVKGRKNLNWQWSFSFENMGDSGLTRGENKFAASSMGLKSSILHFFGKRGRVEGWAEWYRAGGKGGSLPPEALKGLSVGETRKLTLQSSILVGQNFSVNVNILYLDDARYDHFITLKGEVRAYF